MEFQRIQLSRAKLPALPAGRYQVSARQSLVSPENAELPKAYHVFHVGGRRFTMPPETVYAIYPPENTIGNFSESLPHILFTQASLPWMRGLGVTNSVPTPWLALICLSEGEPYEERELTIHELTETPPPDIYQPHWTVNSTTGETNDELCRVLEVDTGLLADCFPREDELSLLAHVRQVDLHDTRDDLIPLDGCFSVLTCNRLPDSPLVQPKKSTIYLLSLEGYHQRLPEGDQFSEVKQFPKARFPVLYHWSFCSQSSLEPGFREVMEKLDSAVFSPICPNSESSASRLLKRGYLPLKHITRTGEHTLSLYRGPLLPFGSEPSPRGKHPTADGEIRYDPEFGIFDMSYSAAWQLGRMIALADKGMAQMICRWRRDILEQRCCTLVRKRMNAQINTNEAAGNDPKETFLSRLASCNDGFTSSIDVADPSGLAERGIDWLWDIKTVKSVYKEGCCK